MKIRNICISVASVLTALCLVGCSCSNPSKPSTPSSPSSPSSPSEPVGPQTNPLIDAKNSALLDIAEAFDVCDKDDYSPKNWDKLVQALTKAKDDINVATSTTSVDSIKLEAITAIEGVPTIEESLSKSPFRISSGKYNLDADDEKVYISYDEWPGDWTYVGNTTYNYSTVFDLKHNFAETNAYRLTAKNTGSNSMYFYIALASEASGAEYKSDIYILAAGEEKEITVPVAEKVDYLYTFVNSSCVEGLFERIEGPGSVEISKFGFVKVDESILPPAPIVTNNISVKPNADISTTPYVYPLTDVENPNKINKVKVVLDLDYNGAGVESQWYGGIVSLGGSSCNIEGNGYVADVESNGVSVSREHTIVLETSGLTNQSALNVAINYMGGNFIVKVKEFVLYYSNGAAIEEERIETTDSVIWDGTNHPYTFEYSQLTKKGTLQKIVLGVKTTNTAGYVGGTFFIPGFNFNSSSLVSLGKAMINNGTTTGELEIYPEVDVNLAAANGKFTIDCWWAPASEISLEYVKFYTETEVAPEAPDNFFAHASNGEVILTWDFSKNATSYDVYCDGDLYMNTDKNYITVDNLENGTEYEFFVKAKNSAGESSTDVCKATPSENSENFEPFIDSLNTDLERAIGEEKMITLFQNSIVSTGNNYRLKTALEKMKQGEEVTVSYLGGSITVGENSLLIDQEGLKKGYAYYSYDYMANAFGTGSNVKYVNAGISGTGSEIGIIRVDEDILAHNSDIIFIEYAGNNSSTEFYKETYESLIRKCLQDENAPAVVLIMCATYYTGGSEDTYATENYMTKFGNYYELPIMSINQGLRSICTLTGDNRLDVNDPIFRLYCAEDNVHQTDIGHQLFGKVLANFIRRIDQETMDSEYQFKQAIYNSSETKQKYDDLERVSNDSSYVKSLGAWTNEAPSHIAQQLKETHVSALTHGWTKTGTTNEALVFEFEAKNLIVNYRADNPDVDLDTGVIVVKYTNLDDPTDKGEVSWDMSIQNNNDQPGWRNSVSVLIFDNPEAANYRVEISMTEATSAKTGTIYALGITK